MDRRGDLAFAAVVAAYGALLIYTTSLQSPGPTFDPLGKQGLPYATGAFMLIIGLVLVGRRLRTWRAEASNIVWNEGTEDEEGHPASSLRAFAVIGATFAYVLLTPFLGYLITTPIYIVLGLWFLGIRSVLMLALASIIFTVAVFFIFNNLLGVPLPVGPLSGILVDLGLIDRVR